MRPLMPLLIASLFFTSAMSGNKHDGILAQETPKLPAKADMVNRHTTESRARVQEEALFDRLIGTWDVNYEIYDKDGKRRHYRGQVISSWILDGAALQE